MSGNHFTITLYLFILTSNLISGQNPNNAPGEAGFDSYQKNFGKFIVEFPFGARLYENQFIKAEDLYDNMKNQCKGKAIYVDFWATWCQPCIQEMHHNKMLYAETRGLPVVFIYICTADETNINTWITRISILKQPGIHIFMKDEVLRDLLKVLNTTGGFPTHVFIDKNGKYKPGAVPLNDSTPEGRLEWLLKNQSSQ